MLLRNNLIGLEHVQKEHLNVVVCSPNKLDFEERIELLILYAKGVFHGESSAIYVKQILEKLKPKRTVIMIEFGHEYVSPILVSDDVEVKRAENSNNMFQLSNSFKGTISSVKGSNCIRNSKVSLKCHYNVFESEQSQENSSISLSLDSLFIHDSNTVTINIDDKHYVQRFTKKIKEKQPTLDKRSDGIPIFLVKTFFESTEFYERTRMLVLHTCHHLKLSGEFEDRIYQVTNYEKALQVQSKLCCGPPSNALIWLDFGTDDFLDTFCSEFTKWITPLCKIHTTFLVTGKCKIDKLLQVEKKWDEDVIEWGKDVLDKIYQSPSCCLLHFQINLLLSNEANMAFPHDKRSDLAEAVLGNCSAYISGPYKLSNLIISMQAAVQSISELQCLYNNFFIQKNHFHMKKKLCKLFGNLHKVELIECSSHNGVENSALLLDTMNDQQLVVYEELSSALLPDSGTSSFRIDGPAGSGKTFMAVNLIVYYLCNVSNKKVMYVADSDELTHYVFKWIWEKLKAVLSKGVEILDAISKIRLMNWNTMLVKEIDVKQSGEKLKLSKENAYSSSDSLIGDIGMIVVDEAHSFIYPNQQHLEARRKLLRDWRNSNPEQTPEKTKDKPKLLFLSDLSQVRYRVDELRYKEMWTREKIEKDYDFSIISRSTKELAMASMAHAQLRKTVSSPCCSHNVEGVSTRYHLIQQKSGQHNSSHAYLEGIKAALSDMKHELVVDSNICKVTNLHKKIAILFYGDELNDNNFKEKVFEELKQNGFLPKSALDVVLSTSKNETGSPPWIVVDAISRVNGLEFLAVIAVGFDGTDVCKAYKAFTRSQIYLALVHFDNSVKRNSDYHFLRHLLMRYQEIAKGSSKAKWLREQQESVHVNNKKPSHRILIESAVVRTTSSMPYTILSWSTEPYCSRAGSRNGKEERGWHFAADKSVDDAKTKVFRCRLGVNDKLQASIVFAPFDENAEVNLYSSAEMDCDDSNSDMDCDENHEDMN